MKLPFAVIALVVFASSPARLLAHEGHVHKLMGTVTAVDAEMKHVEIQTTDGKTASFYVSEATKYLKGKTPASLADLKPGARVVVSAKQDAEKKMIASEVQLGAAQKPKAAATPHQ